MTATIELPLPDGTIAAIDPTVESTIVPCRPGLFEIGLLPRPGGGFDHTKFLKTPMQAWQIGGGCSWGRPMVSGATVTDGWAVLLPDGSVIVDEYTALDFDGPIRLQDWINSEIEWLKVAHHYMDPDQMKLLLPPREAIFCYGEPIAKAIVTMMPWRTDDWIGTPEELLAELSAFGLSRGCPFDPFVVAMPAIARTKEVLADAGIVVERIDGGRIRMGRRASPGQSFSIGSVVAYDN